MKCFSHNDLDGRGARALVAQYENNYNEEDYFEVDYVQELPLDKILKDEKVYFVDYSFSKNTYHVLLEILKITKNVIWIDHHQSSIDLIDEHPELESIEGIVRNNNISGAGLTWMYFNKKDDLSEAPEFVKLISDYDCWILSNKNAMFFKLGMDALPNKNVNDEVWSTLLSDSLEDDLIKMGKTISLYMENDNREYCEKYSFETKLPGFDYKVLACNRKSNSLLFGDKINDYDIVCPFVYDGNKYTYSLFTNKDNIDCRKIAESFGGGGHKQAAGFSNDNLIFHIEVDEDSISSIPLKTGDKAVVEVFITDADKAFNFIGKNLHRGTSEDIGFEILTLAFTKDKYKNYINTSLRNELNDTINYYMRNMNENINKLLGDRNE